MRIECDYCLKVYESEDSENERGPCPFCASFPDRSTAREFKVVPDRPRIATTPFGFDSAPPTSARRTSIVCPPASRSLDEPPRHGAETPAYVRIVGEVPETERMSAPPADRTSDPAKPPSLPAIALPPIGS